MSKNRIDKDPVTEIFDKHIRKIKEHLKSKGVKHGIIVSTVWQVEDLEGDIMRLVEGIQ